MLKIKYHIILDNSSRLWQLTMLDTPTYTLDTVPTLSQKTLNYLKRSKLPSGNIPEEEVYTTINELFHARYTSRENDHINPNILPSPIPPTHKV